MLQKETFPLSAHDQSKGNQTFFPAQQDLLVLPLAFGVCYSEVFSLCFSLLLFIGWVQYIVVIRQRMFLSFSMQLSIAPCFLACVILYCVH